jgi:DNA mismatch repair protein MSH6
LPSKAPAAKEQSAAKIQKNPPKQQVKATDQLFAPDQKVEVGITQQESKVFAEEQEEEKQGRSGLGWENLVALLEATKDGPWWTQKEYIKDSQGRRPDDPDYDGSTVFIPEDEWELLTQGMKAYWSQKRNNFDKILLYRFGHWFLVFYQDAEKCHRYIDLHIPPKLL